MKKIFLFIIVLLIFCPSAFAGYLSPDAGGFITVVTVPMAVTESPDAKLKSAEGSYFSFLQPLSIIPGMGLLNLWVFSIGDASIENIAKKADIKTIHHVDERTNSFTFLWQWFKMKSYRVYGT